MSSKLRAGRVSELRIAGELLGNGYEVYFPVVDDAGVDIVVRAPGRRAGYVGLQIKSAKQLSQFRGLRKPARSGDWRLVLHYRPAKGDERFYVLRANQLELTQAGCIRKAAQELRDMPYEVLLRRLPRVLSKSMRTK